MQRRSSKVWLAEHFLHFGWALLGQECDCGHNRFNWLARLIGEGKWTDDLEPANLSTRLKYNVGNGLVQLHNRMMAR